MNNVPLEIRLEQSFNKTFKKQVCLAPKELNILCSKKNKRNRAHTVSKSSSLNYLVDKTNHLYSLKFNIKKLIKDKKHFTFEKIGINDASTYNMFCKKHDELFKSIDKDNFDLNDKNIFLLTYRNLSKSLYLKQRQIEEFSVNIPTITENYNHINKTFSNEKTQLEPISKIKSTFDKELVRNDYQNISYYAVIIDRIPDVMCAGCFIPDVDFHGDEILDYEIKDILEEEINIISTSIIKYGHAKGSIIFSWNNLINSYECISFISSLISLDYKEQIKAIISFIFKKNKESLYLSPEWFDNLSIEKKELIEKCYIPIEYQIHENMEIPIFDDDLSNFKDFDFLNWNIIDTKLKI